MYIEFEEINGEKGKPKRVVEEKCECCGHIKRTYTRAFNSNMAMCLIALVKHRINGFVKVEDFLLKNRYERCGDFSYLVHYNFLRRQGGLRDDQSTRTGYYQITSAGIMFAEGKTTAKEYFRICENKFLGFDGKDINIIQALGKKFNYEKLIKGDDTKEN